MLVSLIQFWELYWKPSSENTDISSCGGKDCYLKNILQLFSSLSACMHACLCECVRARVYTCVCIHECEYVCARMCMHGCVCKVL